MARMIPETILEFDPQGREDVVFNALKSGLGNDYWVLHSCGVNQTGRDGAFYEKEIDFVVYHRDRGILCLEVKNGVHIAYYGGCWRYSSGRPMPHHGPFKQAQLERISICNLLSKRGEETAVIKGVGKFRDVTRRCRVAWGVWFHGMAKSDLDAVSFPPEAPRDRVLSVDDLSPENVQVAIDRLFASAGAHGLETRLDDEDDAWILNEVLVPSIPGLCPSGRAKADFGEVVYRQLIQEQARVLDFLEGQRSAVINGMAGTGKTFIALERARRCAMRGERTLYLCFNTALCGYLMAEFSNAHPELAELVDFKTIDDFVAVFSGPLPKSIATMKREEVVELQLGRYKMATQKLKGAVDAFPYTQVIVDEGQDCAIPFIEDSGIVDAVRDVIVGKKGEAGLVPSFFMFYDAFQLVSLSAQDSADLPRVIRDADCKLTLYKNCRNTCAIANAAASGILERGKVPEMAVGALAGESPEIVFLDAEMPDDAYVSAVEEAIAGLSRQFCAEDIVVISCSPMGDGHSRLESRLSSNGSGDKVFNRCCRFSTYRKFKGLDAAAVVLVDVDKNAFAGTHGAMPFYEGASRARHSLVVFASLSENDCRAVAGFYSADVPEDGVKSFRRCLADLFKLSMVEYPFS